MSQFHKIVENILQEAKQVGTLYHSTTLKGLINILQTNTIKSSLETGISFTRNKNFIYNNHPFILVLDGDKLSENYKVQPFDYAPFSRGQIKRHSEYETSVFPNKRNIPNFINKLKQGNTDLNLVDDEDIHILKNVNKYLKAIIVNNNFISNEKWDSILNSASKEYLDTPQKVLEYGKKYIKTMYPNLPIIENK